MAVAKATVQHRHIKMVSGFVEEDEDEDDEDAGEERVVTGPVRLRDVRGSRVERIKSGIKSFDRLMGGGLVRGFVYVFSGAAGSGKSTIMLRLVSSMFELHCPPEDEPEEEDEPEAPDEPDEPDAAEEEEDEPTFAVYYASAEEAEKRVRSRAKRIGANIDAIDIWHECDIDAHQETDEFESADVVIYDSLQRLTCDGRYAPVLTVHKIKEQAERLNHVAIVISQLTKEGDTAGSNAIIHDVDGVLDLLVGGDKASDRVLRVRKHREGDAPRQIRVMMTKKGIAFGVRKE